MTGLIRNSHQKIIFTSQFIYSKFISNFTNWKYFSTKRYLMEEQKIKVGDLSINYVKVGSGKPLLCLPGALGFISNDFGPQIKNFNLDKFTIVAWDPPGYGNSRPPMERDFSSTRPNSKGMDYFERDANSAKLFMKELGFDKFSVLGWSDGGITSLVMTKLYPEIIDKIVIWGVTTSLLKSDIEISQKLKNTDNWSERMKRPMIEMYGEEYFKKMWEEVADAFLNIYKNHSGILFRKEDVNVIQQQTLIIHGMKDPIVRIDHAKFLNENIKNSTLHLVPEGKHNLHLKFETEFQNIVEDFLMK